LQIPRSTNTRFPKYQFSKIQVFYGQVCTRMPFKRRKCYSPTSRQARVLVVQASIAAYLQDLEIFFPTICSTQESKGFILTSYVQGQIFTCPQPRIPFFWFTSSGVHKQPLLFEVLAPASLFLQGSHVQRQYQKQTTLCSKSSTIKELLYAPDPHNREKGTLSDQPQLSRVSFTALLCIWGRIRSKI
jgi:hypothetical protein